MMPHVTPETSFAEQGFYCPPEAVVPARTVAEAVEGMEAVREGHYDTGQPPMPSPWRPGDDPDVLCKIELPQRASTTLQRLLAHPAFGAFVGEATGAEAVQAWWVQLLHKPPSKPQTHTSVGWHQDYFYWRDNWQGPEGLLTAWIALSDVRADSGPMRFVPGSHRWGFLDEGDFFGQDNDALRNGISVPAGETWREVAAVLPPGGISLHDSLTFHGSGPNESTTPRRSLAVHLRTDAARPLGGRHGLTQFLDDHDLCPVIYGDASKLA